MIAMIWSSIAQVPPAGERVPVRGQRGGQAAAARPRPRPRPRHRGLLRGGAGDQGAASQLRGARRGLLVCASHLVIEPTRAYQS